jgi:hypothetical protein
VLHASPETLAFLAPGLLHQLGNVLFTIRGNAEAAAFATDGGERQRLAIATAADRGAEALRVLRCLLGDAASAPVPAVSLLTQVAELARVPLREAKLALEVDLGSRTTVRVDPIDFYGVVFEALRGLVAVLPSGATGSIGLELVELADHRVAVGISFQAPAGTLPFPLPLKELAQRIAGTGSLLGGPPRVRADGHGLLVEFRTHPGSPPAGP